MGHLQVRLNHVAHPGIIEELALKEPEERAAQSDARRQTAKQEVDEEGKEHQAKEDAKDSQAQVDVLVLDITIFKLLVLLFVAVAPSETGQ